MNQIQNDHIILEKNNQINNDNFALKYEQSKSNISEKC